MAKYIKISSASGEWASWMVFGIGFTLFYSKCILALFVFIPNYCYFLLFLGKNMHPKGISLLLLRAQFDHDFRHNMSNYHKNMTI
jgi:hypothetical protein